MSTSFAPKFFTQKQFKVFVKVVDAMIDTPGDPALSPLDVAQKMDHLLDQIDSPAIAQIGQIMWLVNWMLPTLIFKPGLFVNHSRDVRRKAIKRVIQKRGLLRDVARGLKLLSMVAYYSSQEGKREVGFVEFDDRPRTPHLDQRPIHHPDNPIA